VKQVSLLQINFQPQN